MNLAPEPPGAEQRGVEAIHHVRCADHEILVLIRSHRLEPGKDEKTINQTNPIRREGEQAGIDLTLKPGQGIEDLIVPCLVPAETPLPKLILNAGREGTSDKVIRYMLGTGKNIVKPLSDLYVDPAVRGGGHGKALIEYVADRARTKGAARLYWNTHETNATARRGTA